jgi:AraC-like DNA-binding protein
MLVRTASLTHYAEVARAAGLDAQRMLAAAGLSPAVLDEPDLKVPVERVARLLEASAAASGDESFGLRMAEPRALSNLGPVGLLLRDQPTLREALQVVARYHRVLNGALSMAIDETDGVVVIREDLTVGNAQPVRQGVELALGVLLRLMRQFLGAEWQARHVCLMHAAPRQPATHLRVFGPCVRFDQDFNGIVCGTADLDACSPSADRVMARYAQQLIDASVGAPAPTMLEEVRQAVVTLLPSGRCSIEKVSRTLGVTCRTVQRRLAEQGEGFSSLVNGVRTGLAARHVADSDRPLIEVAGLLGFSAQSAFSRWHREQFGCSPRERRAAAGRLSGCSARSLRSS